MAYRLMDWMPVVLGLLVMYVPVYYGLANGLWKEDDHAHEAIVFVVVLWLFWQSRVAFAMQQGKTSPLAGWVLMVIGSLLYVVGRSQDITILAVASQMPVFVGALLVLRGWGAVRALWFPLAYLVFMVPLPSVIVDALTGPLKFQISIIAENLLYFVGYPIARNGVVLSVGPYQLLVADACSGLNSIISLSAMGLLYLYLMKPETKWRIAAVIALIIPVAFCANIVRVIALVLVTYHFGDEAGQGFLHGFAGILVFVVGLVMLMTLDGVLGRIEANRLRKSRRGLDPASV